MNGIDLSLEKSAFKINSSPSARSIIEEDALKRAIKGAEEALTFARRARTEAEGYSTGNPSDKSTMAYATIEGRTAILSELIKDMTRSAKRLDAYWEKDPKKQEEYRADFEYEGVGIEDLEKEYETDALAVLDTITKIREAVMRNA